MTDVVVSLTAIEINSGELFDGTSEEKLVYKTRLVPGFEMRVIGISSYPENSLYFGYWRASLEIGSVQYRFHPRVSPACHPKEAPCQSIT